MRYQGYPFGFGLALVMDPDAMRNFAILPQQEKAQVMQQARQISSRKEMQDLIHSLASGTLH